MTFFEGIFYEAVKTFVKRVINLVIDRSNSKNNIETNFLKSSRDLFVKRIYEIFTLHEINKEDISEMSSEAQKSSVFYVKKLRIET